MCVCVWVCVGVCVVYVLCVVYVCACARVQVRRSTYVHSRKVPCTTSSCRIFGLGRVASAASAPGDDDDDDDDDEDDEEEDEEDHGAFRSLFIWASLLTASSFITHGSSPVCACACACTACLDDPTHTNARVPGAEAPSAFRPGLSCLACTSSLSRGGSPDAGGGGRSASSSSVAYGVKTVCSQCSLGVR